MVQDKSYTVTTMTQLKAYVKTILAPVEIMNIMLLLLRSTKKHVQNFANVAEILTFISWNGYDGIEARLNCQTRPRHKHKQEHQSQANVKRGDQGLTILLLSAEVVVYVVARQPDRKNNQAENYSCYAANNVFCRIVYVLILMFLVACSL